MESSMMWTEADAAVRDYVPFVLDVAGLQGVAEDLRTIPPIICYESVTFACQTLSNLQHVTSQETNCVWNVVIEDVLFWAQALVWAAARGDSLGFEEYMLRMKQSVERSSSASYLH